MKAAQFTKKLLQWFQKHKEPYFFRVNRNPYTTWVSEVALQQTRLEAALPKLKHFLNCFPTLEALAKAPEDEVLAAFRGLGYYNRARNLKKGALFLLENYAGSFPKNVEHLKKIPSIGEYTAAFIASACFQKKEPVLDGNVKRVLSRFLHCQHPIEGKLFKREALSFLNSCLEYTSTPGDFNEALMELGQKICTVSNPMCAACPIQKGCLGKEHSAHLPIRLPPPPKIKVTWEVFIVQQKNQILVCRFGKHMPFLRGHWGFPSRVHFPTKTIGNVSQETTRHKLGSFQHTITRHKITVSIQQASWLHCHDESLFLTKEEIKTRLAASAMLKVFQKL